MELFDAEPEFPPFTNYEQMREEYNPGTVERYLEPHGDPNLLHSRRLVVQPDAEADGAATWGEFSGASATASIEPGSTAQGGRNCSHVTIGFDGLYPDGVYTVWAVHEPGMHRPLGGNAGDENAFTADGDGHYTLEVVDHPDELTLPPAESDDEIGITQEPLHEIPEEFFFVVPTTTTTGPGDHSPARSGSLSSSSMNLTTNRSGPSPTRAGRTPSRPIWALDASRCRV